ncbi:MAG: hypothetical protein FWG78_01395 [Coriobacteriia bacterium]|nr:hypothetical protein [Coriobacteriia bacterium]
MSASTQDDKLPFGAQPYVAYLSLVGGVSALLAFFVDVLYPVILGFFAFYLGYLVWSEPEADRKLKLIAKIGTVLGAMALVAFMIFWLIGYFVTTT